MLLTGIPTSGGLVKASIAEGQDGYEGSEANGVTSREWASYETRLVIAAGEEKARAAAVADARRWSEVPC